MKFTHTLMGVLAGVMLASAAALAQDAAPAAANGPKAPGAPDVKSVGDWFVRCFPVQNPSPCDVFQELDDQRSRQRVLSISIAYVPSLDKHGVQITVPLEVSLSKGLVIQTDSYTSPVLKYRRCNRNGCYVEMPLDNAVVEAMTKSGPDAKIKIVADNGKNYDLRFSLKGFAQAHDQMVADARAKAKPVQQPAQQQPAAAPKP